MKLLIAIPTLDYIHVDFMKCLLNLTNSLKDEGIPFEVKIISGTLVYLARDSLAGYACSESFTHVLWLDSDMIFDEDVFDNLYDVGKDFVCGIFHARRPGHQSCIFKSLNPVERYRWNTYPSVPFEIAACGMACVLMTTEIIQKVKEKFGSPFEPAYNLGEDLAFCHRVNELGIEMWCEPGVRVGHIGHLTVWPEDEGRYWEQLKR